MLLLCMFQFCISLSMGLVDPILPLYASSFDVSFSMVGLFMSSFGITRTFSEIPGGLVMNRIGKKSVILFGSTLYIASYIILALAQNFNELIISRMIIGIGSALVYTSTLTHIGEIAPVDQRAKFLAYFQSSYFMGGIIGPVLGGFISNIFNTRAIFVVSFVVSAIGVSLVLLLKVRERPSGSAVGPQKRPEFLGIIKDIRIITLSFSCFIMFFIYDSIRGMMIPLYGAGELGISQSLIGITFSLISAGTIISLLFLTPRVEKVIKRSSQLFISLLVSSVSVFLISFSSDFTTLTVLSVLFGIGTGLLHPTPFAMLIDYTNHANRSVMMGFLRTIGDLGIVLGPILVGLLIDIGQPLFVFYLVAGFTCIFSFLTFFIFRVNQQ